MLLKIPQKPIFVSTEHLCCGDRVVVRSGPFLGHKGTCYSFALMGDINVEMDDASLGIITLSINVVEKIVEVGL